MSMPQANIVMNVRRVSSTTSIIDIQGDLSAFAEPVLMDVYTQPSSPTTRIIMLNFTGLAYMNSSEIGLLATLLIRIHRQKQHLICFRVNPHHKPTLLL